MCIRDRGHGGAEGSHSRQHQCGCVLDRSGFGPDRRRYTDVLERLLDRAKIARSVVDDVESAGFCRRSSRTHKTPLVEGMPVARGSGVTACLNALPKALKTASMVW